MIEHAIISDMDWNKIPYQDIAIPDMFQIFNKMATFLPKEEQMRVAAHFMSKYIESENYPKTVQEVVEGDGKGHPMKFVVYRFLNLVRTSGISPEIFSGTNFIDNQLKRVEAYAEEQGKPYKYSPEQRAKFVSFGNNGRY